jgi:hypothetical protein
VGASPGAVNDEQCAALLVGFTDGIKDLLEESFSRHQAWMTEQLAGLKQDSALKARLTVASEHLRASMMKPSVGLDKSDQPQDARSDPGCRNTLTVPRPTVQGNQRTVAINDVDEICDASRPVNEFFKTPQTNSSSSGLDSEELQPSEAKDLPLEVVDDVGDRHKNDDEAEEAKKPRAGTLTRAWAKLVAPLHRAKAWAENANVMTRANSEKLHMFKQFSTVTEGDAGERRDRRKTLHRLYKDRRFDVTVSCLIVVQALVLGIEAEENITAAMHETIVASLAAANVFLDVFFAFEITVRMAVERSTFFSSRNRNIIWNVMDTFLVLCSIAEAVGALYQELDSGQADTLQTLRKARLIRVFRAIRVIRMVRFMKELQTMLQGIKASAKPLLCASMLLLMFMYVFAIGVCFIVAEERRDVLSGRKRPGEGFDFLREHYWGVWPTTYTLFLSISGGIDWMDAAAPLIEVSPAMQPAFCMYIVFTLFCVLNIITGVFVENARKDKAGDEQRLIVEHMENREKWYGEVHELFEIADDNGNGEIDESEFAAVLKEPHFQALCAEVGLNVEGYATKGLFNLFDFDGRGTINMEEFTDGILHLHGSAKSIDVYLLRRDNNRIFERLSELFTVLLNPGQLIDHEEVSRHQTGAPVWSVSSVPNAKADALKKVMPNGAMPNAF